MTSFKEDFENYLPCSMNIIIYLPLREAAN